MDTKKRIQNIFDGVFSEGARKIEISDETTAEDIEGWSSLKHFKFIAGIEKEFGIGFTAAEVRKFRAMGDFIAAVRNRRNPGKNVLYFLPYSGASKVTFKDWAPAFAPEIEFKALDYAGHGNRRGEGYYSSVSEACADIYNRIKDDQVIKDSRDIKDGKRPKDRYYLAGHCLGGILAYEVYYRILEKKKFGLPEGIFISGQGAPDRMRGEKLSVMENRELLKYLHSLGAVDEGMLDEELYGFVEDFVLAPVKADSKIYEDYVLKAGREPVESSVYVMYGRDDQTYPADEMGGWSRFASRPVRYRCYEAGHYFINSLTSRYIEDIKKAVAENEGLVR